MGVYLPTAALGNSRMLACFGGRAEIMAFFAPNLDFAQHVREGLPAIWLPADAGEGRLLFMFDTTFASQQSFRAGSNVLDTVLRSDELDLSLSFTDVAHERMSALTRQIRIGPAGTAQRSSPGVAQRARPRSRSDTGVAQQSVSRPFRFMHYFRLALGECDEKNAVHFLPRYGVMRQLWRDHCVVIGISRPFAYQCGKVRDAGSQVKWDMGRGWLSGQEQDIGRVDFAVGVNGAVDDSEPFEVTLAMVHSSSEEEAVHQCRQLLDADFSSHVSTTTERCHQWLTPLVTVEDRSRKAAMERALLTIRDLADAGTGAIVAAPEFDPAYELSGGYGYCWPRDAAEVCLALAELGETSLPRAALDWCASTQLGNGHWYQRYWSDGSRGPSWCVYEDFYQLDQTCAAAFAISRYADHLDGVERSEYLGRMLPCVRRACEALQRALTLSGLHDTAADLWEVHRGSFTYTNAALYGALVHAGRVFGIDPAGAPARIKRAVLETLWIEEEGRFARGLDERGNVDRSLDSSIIGAFDPFGLLDLASPAEREMACRTLAAVEERLSVPVDGGRAILQFEHEDYMGGGPGVVNTLWVARAHLKLARALAADASREAALTRVGAAQAYIDVALRHTNPTGQLPELIPWNGYPYWAAPHGWASALLVDCFRLLREWGSDADRPHPA